MFLVLVGLLFVLSISFVSAIDACCELTRDGDSCVYTDEDECAAGYQNAYTTCEQTSYCQVGTCYSSDDGSCYGNTARSTCEAEEGTTWTSEPIDSVAQCQQGCCVVADQAFFVTEVKCKSVGSQYEDADISFDDSIETEALCLDSVKNLDEGCCVSDDSWEFTTRESCGADIAEVGTNFTEVGFHEGMLCSNDLLSAECAKQHHTSCYQGKVYWYDSCGNRENIYSGDERESYNSGYILDEEDSCTINGPNDPSCGNCDYTLGTQCSEDTENLVEVGDYICADLNCYETYENDASPLSGFDKKNGESWCVYDARVGEGQDTVGSRHYRHLCINGEEIVEECTDFREEICISGVLNEDTFGNQEALGLSGDFAYVEAACRSNRNECGVCNDPDDGLSSSYNCCVNEDLRDCYWLEGNVACESDDECGIGGSCEGSICVSNEDESIQAGMCVPQVPPGLEFYSSTGSSDDATSSSICNVASTECSATYRIGGWKNLVKEKFGRDKSTGDDWELISESPDGCTSKNWVVSQNNLCRAQGDCGIHYNYNGDVGYGGLTSTLFDEDFFFEVDEIDSSDIGSWDYYSSVDNIDEASEIGGFNSPKMIKNPAFWIGVSAMVVGGTSGAVACNQEKIAKGLISSANAEAKKAKEVEKAKDDNKEEEEEEEDEGEGDSDESDSEDGEGDSEGEEAEGDSEGGDEGGDEGGEAEGGDDAGGEESSESSSESVDDSDVKGKSEAPAVLFQGSERDNLGTASSALSGVQTLTSAKESFSSTFGETAECFVTSAIPLYGLQRIVDKDLIEDSSKLTLNNAVKAAGYAKQVTSHVSKARAAGTVSKVANFAAIAAAAYLAVEYAFDNETTFVYDVGCNLWQPPTGGDNCELCNDIDRPCSEYKCRSLGASCDLVNEGTSNETCVSLHVNDVNSPIVSPLEDVFTDGYTITTGTDEGNSGFEINELIPAFTNVQVGISTDEPAQCKYSSDPSTEFDDMQSYFGSEVYLYNHSLMFSLGEEATDEDIIALTDGIYTIYVRCADANGNPNERDYYIRYQVDDSPDLTPPSIEFTTIASGSYMPYELEETDFAIYTNEPADCRWASNDSSYQFMDNEMTCASSSTEQTSAYFGTYECSTRLSGLSDSELNYYYFRCSDQTGNVNEESYEFLLKSTEAPLEIVSISPEGELSGTDLALEIETKNGCCDGDATCKFYNEDVAYSNMIEFAESNATEHSQVLTLTEGDFSYYVTCQDVAGNEASNSTEFNVIVDLAGPSVEYVYVSVVYGTVNIEMDEESSCEWAGEEFVYGEGTTMTGDGTTEHEASLETSYYYIICEDVDGNQGSYEVDLSAWV
tara:strand:- start:1787 stop:5794 length:4008 start_codon:yes stop_codon:yes gene_type:complete